MVGPEHSCFSDKDHHSLIKKRKIALLALTRLYSSGTLLQEVLPLEVEMSTVALVALARPTFDLGCAQANFDSARALLEEFGATVVGPAELVMTVDDVAAVELPAADLHILFMASFSDA